MVNNWHGIGNTTADAEVRYTDGGTAVANFTVAINEKWKDKDGNPKEKAEFIKVVAFGRLAEVCGEYLKKGKQTYVSGSIQTRSWDKDGEKKYMTEIKANVVQFLSSKGEKTEQQHEDPDVAPEVGIDEDSDIPFN